MSSVPDPKTIYEKYLNGDKLSNEEVIYGAEFYRVLADTLIKCGPVFRLACKEACSVYIGLDGYKSARKI